MKSYWVNTGILHETIAIIIVMFNEYISNNNISQWKNNLTYARPEFQA